ncbi:hypothetical protein [Paraburkholderia lycopersici]|uniref:Uncharacterized protein n=1 Tax=Paraburkholderia lycopersici TaxID=416944 RepID=A0A1G7CCT5_9BURK|nr:hypothetical protein [Paraburkholderia lycopersici]SDE37119.1 hypothetical protein SAMN05421548_14429 [Paraburkholderia lycopersici]
MELVTLDAVEFTFFPVALETGKVAHRAMFIGTLALPVVVIYRADGKRSARIAFDVPRDVAKAKHYADHADVVRDAIGQAIRDNLFDNPPEATNALANDAPRWPGNLQLART